MNKDVIYIDVEDDITSIISKVKAGTNSIVALVPPKRIGVLQSAVNLKLLQRAAKTEGKHVVLITSDHSLLSLAAGIKMPIAKNLQSRPEIPHSDAPEITDEEVINGNELSVGELDSKLGAAAKKPSSKAEEIGDQIDLTDEIAESKADEQADKKSSPLKKAKDRAKIPNFNSFRVKLFVIAGGGILLVALLVWAFIFAPSAKVIITAKNQAVSVDRTLHLDPAVASSDTNGLVLKPLVQQVKKSVATEFNATGTKDVGTKATGTITVKNCDSTTSFSLAAGSTFTAAGGFKFTSNASATIPGFSGSSSDCRNNGTGAGKADVAVTAADIGTEYNIDATSFTISGVSGDVYANSAAAMSGGTKEKATVVSQDDVDKAKESLTAPKVDEIKNSLKKQFGANYLIIDESYISEPGQPVSTPAVGEKATKAKLTLETTYTIVGIQRSDAKSVIEKVVNDYLKDNSNQQTNDLGENTISFQAFQKAANNKYSVRLVTTAYVGAKIDLASLKNKMAGKRFGEIEAIANEIPDVQNVDVKFSPFWVTSAPAADKIEISFTIQKNGN